MHHHRRWSPAPFFPLVLVVELMSSPFRPSSRPYRMRTVYLHSTYYCHCSPSRWTRWRYCWPSLVTMRTRHW
uniref:Putative secreted protein n=1 Tax=Anopheles darlingi TaxID=43151 RepID=A0A2M4DC49_ANODA